MFMGGVYEGLGGLSLPISPVTCKSKMFNENNKGYSLQLTHNVNDSGTSIPILCSEIYRSVYFLAVTRPPVCGKDGAGSIKQ